MSEDFDFVIIMTLLGNGLSHRTRRAIRPITHDQYSLDGDYIVRNVMNGIHFP